MNGQLELVEAAPPKLTDRQATILDALQHAGQDGLDTDQAGAHWHAAKGIHRADTRCRYCAQDGKGILEALRAKGLARYRRANRSRSQPGVWLATNVTEDPADDTTLLRGMSAEIPY